MIVKISASTINGILTAPASKSSMQRACAAAILHNGITVIYNEGISNDDKAALKIITQLGAKINRNDADLEIFSDGFFVNNNILTNINCGESGLAIRMFTPIVALSKFEVNINGEGSLLKRPMNFFDDILPQLGINILSNNGYLPLQIKGPFQPKSITVDGSLSSQFLTGLLFAFGQAVTDKCIINVIDLKSKPYIDLTLDVMKHFGFNIQHNNYKQFIINPKNSSNDKIEYTVEGDWSSASFLMVAAAIGGMISIKGLDINSTQADKAILQVLQLSNVQLDINETEITVKKSDLIPFEFDATDCPDLFPPLVALAAYCKGKSVIKGVHRLAAKESNRALALQDIFFKMGIIIVIENDTMVINGTAIIKETTINSHGDHRIVMAGAVAAIRSQSNIFINGAEAINKSYPNFFDDIKKMGANVEIIKE